MKPSQCKHFRIRDDNFYNEDVDDLIKCIERKYKIDFKSLPQWKELTKRLHFISTDCKRKLQDANLRKSLIIEKLFIESTRLTPFELSDIFARTGKKWEAMKVKKPSISLKEVTDSITSDNDSKDVSDFDEHKEIIETDHPNSKIDTSVNSFMTENLEVIDKLPYYIKTNQHDLISPLASDDSTLVKSKPISVKSEQKHYENEWMTLNKNKSIACLPTKIILKFDILEEQTLQFKLTNCGGEFMHVRFKTVTDKAQFRRARILPETPVILYPGVPVVYKFVFRLIERKKEFTSQLFFKVGRNVYADAPDEALCIPIISKFIKARSVSVPEIVSIPPIYFWHFNNKYPKYPSAIVRLAVNDDRYYHVRIVKREFDFIQQANSSDTLEKQEAVETSTESEGKSKREEQESKRDKQLNAKEQGASRLKQAALAVVAANLKLFKDMAAIVKDIVELALDTFMFENTYLYLKPDARNEIPVYLTKIEHMGCHNCYYAFELIDPQTEDVVITKIVRIFADVLPNPVQIQPPILVMSTSDMIYGFYGDRFVMTNRHRLFPATINFRLSTETKRIIRITPIETVIPAQSCVWFEVKFCARDRKATSNDLVHFTFEVIVSGYKSIYRNVPPIIYEIIAPCMEELRNANKSKYYRDLMSERAMKLV